jgi:hypothetical protein
VFGEWPRCRRLSKNCFGSIGGFRIFPFYVGVVDGSYCGQLCNNAVNYPSAPLMLLLFVLVFGDVVYRYNLVIILVHNNIPYNIFKIYRSNNL